MRGFFRSETGNFDLLTALAGQRNIKIVLHPHEIFHARAERLFQADRHFGRQRRLLVQKPRQRDPVNAEGVGRVFHRKPKRTDDPGAHKLAGMQYVGRWGVSGGHHLVVSVCGDTNP